VGVGKKVYSFWAVRRVDGGTEGEGLAGWGLKIWGVESSGLGIGVVG